MVELDEGDGFHYLVVRGFGENQLVAVTVGMTKDGFAPGSAGISGTSLQAKVDPILESVTRTADGFRSKVTNWDGGFAYPTEITSPGSVPEGASAIVELDEGDGFHYLVVRGFAPNTTVDVTVSSTQTGFVSGSAGISGTSLQAKVDPILESVTRTADGFRSKVTNWDGGFAYPTEITSPGSVPEGASAMVELDEGDGFHYLVVRGFAPNTTVDVTVSSTQTGFVSGSAGISGTSLQAKVDPILRVR
ncbi:MAG: hypothetical protein V9E85_13775 [Candidatus Nanopelagicales bacterium]